LRPNTLNSGDSIYLSEDKRSEARIISLVLCCWILVLFERGDFVLRMSWIPNSLSLTRLLLGVAFPWIESEWRLWVIVIAAITDFLDGLAARLFHAESDTGRLLDPIADKVFVLVVIGTWIAEGLMHPLWAVGLVVRDLVVLAGLAFVIVSRQWQRGRRMRASWVGKCTTAAQFAVFLALAIWNTAPLVLLIPTVLLSIIAAVDYARTFVFQSVSNANNPARGANPASMKPIL
jgi:phosphatidylglycerophosphate synthase